MKKLTFSLLSSLVMLFLTLTLFAQEVTYSPKASVPLDPAVIYGKLDNGMTYYIRENRSRKSGYLPCREHGALSEDEDQNGLAHFRTYGL
jgi:zinc protease